jgi:hypothetical protein
MKLKYKTIKFAKICKIKIVGIIWLVEKLFE